MVEAESRRDQEFLEWKKHPVTELLFQYLKARRTAILEAWAAGQFTAESSEGTSQQNAKALGLMEAIEGILYMEADDLDQ